MEKRVDCTCIYVLNASSKGSGQTAQIRRLVGAQPQFIDGPRSELSLLVLAIKNANCVSMSLNIHAHQG